MGLCQRSAKVACEAEGRPPTGRSQRSRRDGPKGKGRPSREGAAKLSHKGSIGICLNDKGLAQGREEFPPMDKGGALGG
jgi:hypothetical protein